VIRLQCVCGHELRLPDHLAGQQIRCKTCGKIMRVPAETASGSGRVQRAAGVTDLDPSLRIAGSRPCPGCGAVYPPGVVVCVQCGLNVDSGAMLYVSAEDQAVPPALRGEEAAAPPPPPPPRGWLARLLAKLRGR